MGTFPGSNRARTGIAHGIQNQQATTFAAQGLWHVPPVKDALKTEMTTKSEIDLAAIRAQLDGAHGRTYWRSLEELAETKEFQEMLHREFPQGASEWLDG